MSSSADLVLFAFLATLSVMSRPQYEVWGKLLPQFVVRLAASSTRLSRFFGMNFVIIRRPPCGLHVQLSRVGQCDVEYTR